MACKEIYIKATAYGKALYLRSIFFFNGSFIFNSSISWCRSNVHRCLCFLSSRHFLCYLFEFKVNTFYFIYLKFRQKCLRVWLKYTLTFKVLRILGLITAIHRGIFYASRNYKFTLFILLLLNCFLYCFLSILDKETVLPATT